MDTLGRLAEGWLVNSAQLFWKHELYVLVSLGAGRMKRTSLVIPAKIPPALRLLQACPSLGSWEPPGKGVLMTINSFHLSREGMPVSS